MHAFFTSAISLVAFDSGSREENLLTLVGTIIVLFTPGALQWRFGISTVVKFYFFRDFVVSISIFEDTDEDIFSF